MNARITKEGILTSDLLIFNHTAAMSGGEIALVDLLTFGIADSVHVHVDRDGPLVNRLVGLPKVTTSTRLGGTTPAAARTNRVTKLLSIIVLAIRMRSSYRSVLNRAGGKVVYANTLRSALIVSTLRLRNRPFVFHQRDQLSPEYLGKWSAKFAKLLIGWRATLVIANSQSTAATTPERIDRVEVVPSAVSDEFFELPARDATETIRILMLGRISPWKGQLEFLQALVHLNRVCELPQWTVDIVGGALFGENSYLEDIKKHISDNGLGNKVRLIGHVNDPVNYVGNCDILVHSSVLPEPFGQVVAQGMAAGRAIVASNSGGPAEILTQLTSAILVDPRNFEEFSLALKTLITDQELRSELGRQAKIDAEPFKIGEVGGRIKSLIANLM